jgi:hypothetical protein
MKLLILFCLATLLGASSPNAQAQTMTITPSVDPATGMDYDLIQNPVFPGTNYVFAAAAFTCGTAGKCGGFTPPGDDPGPYLGDYLIPPDGICRALGYDSGLPNQPLAADLQGSDDMHRLQVDEQGNLIGFLAGYTYFAIDCIRANHHPLEKITTYDHPLRPGTQENFSAGIQNEYSACGNNAELASDEDAVCKLLGHGRSVHGSSVVGGNSVVGQDVQCETGNAAIVNAAGKVVGVRMANIMPVLLCVDLL